MIFDQYSRYRSCADIVEIMSNEGDILDVGSGPECLLGHFLCDRIITFVDPLISTQDGVDDKRISGSVFDSRLDFRKFDYVCSVDALEHVPESARKGFVDRLSSLAKHGIVLAFPCADDEVAVQADSDIAAFYRKVHGKDYPWLEEHFRYGLPNKAEVVAQLEGLGWSVSVLGHGHTPWLSPLLGAVISGWDTPEYQSDMLRISKRFNEELYVYDFNPPFYRWYLIATRGSIPSIAFELGSPLDGEAERCFSEILSDTQSTIVPLILKNNGLLDEKLEYAVKERDAALKERDAALKERDAALKERDAAIISKDAALIEIDAARYLASSLLCSKSWRITKPLRFIGRLLRYGLTVDDSQLITKSLLDVYRSLPLPFAVKRKMRSGYYRLLSTYRNSISRHYLVDDIFNPAVVPLVPQSQKNADYVIWGVIDWHFRHQRPQQMAKVLADLGHRVFYISAVMVDDVRNGFDVESIDGQGRLFQVKLFAKGSPTIYSSGPDEVIISQLKGSVGEMLDWADCKRIVSLVQHPFWYDIAKMLPDCSVVYDCMDHHEGFENTSPEIVNLEKSLLQHADLTVTTSNALDATVSKYTKNRVIIRNACDFDHFSSEPFKLYKDPTGRRIIGYYGAIAEWFDQDLIEAIANRFPDCCVLLVGADTVNAAAKLKRLSNVKFIGEVSYSELPSYLYAFDVCILPFKIIPLTLATNPVKVYEYLSAGKSVVSVDLPEMKQFGELVRVAANTTFFLAEVSDVLTRQETTEIICARKTFAKNQTWRHRAEQLASRVEDTTGEPWVTVVVVTYNNLDFTRECLYSLDAHSHYDSLEIIVVDNASTDGTKDFLMEWVDEAPNRKLILNTENRGFAAANNQGLAVADGEFFVLLNNDTYVTPGWVRTLLKHIKHDNSIGLIGPVTNNIGNEAKINLFYESMNEMLSLSSRYTRQRIGKKFPLTTAAFFCVMVPREVYEAVGPLDEAFGQGFFEDDDYCRRIEQHGLRIVCAEDVFVHHHLSASFDKLKDKDRKKLFETNKAVYEAKWGKWIPHSHANEKIVPESTVFRDRPHKIGRCNVCGKGKFFYFTDVALWRESLTCEYCFTTSRYRSITRGILSAVRDLCGVDVSSLAALPHAGVDHSLRVYDTQPPFYYEPHCSYPLPDLLKATGWINVELSQYKPNHMLGKKLSPGVTNQNLECLTFDDESLDIVITSDVMEHVRLDEQAHHEIYRVLRPGGIYIFTVPHNYAWNETLVRVHISDPADPSKDVHLLEPEYHGDTNSDDAKGVLAYRTYGRDIEVQLVELGFEVEYSREDIYENAIFNTELYYCRKSENKY